MAKWRTERSGTGHWWLLSGTHTLGKIFGEATAKKIVREHNEAEDRRDKERVDG